MGIAAIYPGPHLSRRHHDHQIYLYLLRGITAAEPHHIGGIDITSIRMRQGGMYLVAVLDWYSRYVVSGARDDTRELPFVREAVDAALAVATPQIWNSDQGSHVTSPQDTQRLEAAGVRISGAGLYGYPPRNRQPAWLPIGDHYGTGLIFSARRKPGYHGIAPVRGQPPTTWPVDRRV